MVLYQIVWICFLLSSLICRVPADFKPQFEQYEVDSARNESGRYLAQTHADVKYICHYPGPGDKLEDLISYESPQCMKQNKDALNKEEKANKKYPYYFYNIGIAVGCIVPWGLGNLSNGEWICQGDTKKYLAVGIVPVYHSCWLVCNKNYTLSVPLRDYRCTEKQTWDADPTGILCHVNGTDHNRFTDTKNAILEVEMHVAFVVGGCVVLVIAIVLVGCRLYKQYRERSEYTQHGHSSEPLIPSGKPSTELHTQDVSNVLQRHDSSYGSGVDSNEGSNTGGQVREGADGNELELLKRNPPSTSSFDSAIETEVIENVASVVENTQSDSDCMARRLEEDFIDVEESQEHKCSLKIEDVGWNLIRDLGYILDPIEDHKDEETWKGFARNVLKLTDIDINSRKHHHRGDHNNGYFVNMREDMTAKGIYIGDIVKYFARQENLRRDVLERISESHKDCEFCTKYFR